MASLPYFKFYPADFMGSGKVQIMHPAEKGIYISLLCYEWQEGPLPDDSARLGRIAGASSREMKEAWPSVRACFSIDENGCLYHPRLEREREDAMSKSESAKRSASKRWDNEGDANAHPNADANADANAHPNAMLGSDANAMLGSDANAMLGSMPLEACENDAILRSSDTQSTDTQDPEKATASGTRPREGPIGEMESDLARVLESLPDDRTRRRVEAQARMVLTGDDRKAWETDQGTTVPEAERPELFRLALGYHADGSQKPFRSSVRYAVKLYTANERAPPDPRMGRAERKLAERIAKLQSVDLSTAFQS